MVQNNQESRLHYWATCSSVRSIARTAHSFACSALFALLACSAAFTHSLARSFCSLPCSWESDWLDDYSFCVFSVFNHSGRAISKAVLRDTANAPTNCVSLSFCLSVCLSVCPFVSVSQSVRLAGWLPFSYGQRVWKILHLWLIFNFSLICGLPSFLEPVFSDSLRIFTWIFTVLLKSICGNYFHWCQYKQKT